LAGKSMPAPDKVLQDVPQPVSLEVMINHLLN
jgi:hypothetical protein